MSDLKQNKQIEKEIKEDEKEIKEDELLVKEKNYKDHHDIENLTLRQDKLERQLNDLMTSLEEEKTKVEAEVA